MVYDFVNYVRSLNVNKITKILTITGVTAGVAQDETTPVGTTQDETTPVVTTQDETTPVVTTQDETTQ
jgi:hypothetical protein